MNPKSKRRIAMAMAAGLAATASISSAQNAPHQQKKDWRIVTSPNGTIYKFDVNDIGRGKDGFANIVDVMVYVVTGDIVRPSKLRFDCAAHHFWVSDADLRPGPTQYAQPLSIAGQIEQIACARKSSSDDGAAAPVAGSRNALEFYRARYLLAGFLLRAGDACDDGGRKNVAAGFGLLATEELKSVSKSYPETTRQWMEVGSTNFNTQAMKDGIGAACAYAGTVRRQAEDIAKSD